MPSRLAAAVFAGTLILAPAAPRASEAELVEKATAYLRAQQARLERDFALGSFERYDWDQDTARIVFSSGGRSMLAADIVFVGSVNVSKTWLWSWANPSIGRNLSTPVRRVHDLGVNRKLDKLREGKWAADEVDGWEMTAVAALVLKAEGAYRAPGENGFAYLLLFNVRRLAAEAK